MPRVSTEGIGLEDEDAAGITMSIRVQGDDERAIERVYHHAKDAGIRAMQALNEGKHPDDVEGAPIGINWESILEEGGEE